MLTGCDGSEPDPSSASPQGCTKVIPTEPASFGQPKVIPAPKIGEDARAYAARVVVSHGAANRRLENDKRFLDDTRKRMCPVIGGR
ncbi:MAG: hypothetical protein AB7J19_16075 [Beijerinckiaceae bacterium]